MEASNISSNKFIETIASPNAPKAIGPYSQGKLVNKDAFFVYTSGSLGIDPSVHLSIFSVFFMSSLFSQTGKLISDDIVEQTTQVFKK
jgi:enamine deaminase RidA (YjgF/YER057c/UK114 family)